MAGEDKWTVRDTKYVGVGVAGAQILPINILRIGLWITVGSTGLLTGQVGLQGPNGNSLLFTISTSAGQTVLYKDWGPLVAGKVVEGPSGLTGTIILVELVENISEV
jgi:hypothetical protein